MVFDSPAGLSDDKLSVLRVARELSGLLFRRLAELADAGQIRMKCTALLPGSSPGAPTTVTLISRNTLIMIEKCPRCSSSNMFEDAEIIACKDCHYNNVGAKKTLERITGANLAGCQINEISERNHDQNFFLGDL